MTDHTAVMISSTRRDLAAHIDAAQAAIAQCGMNAVMQEDLPAVDADAVDVSLAMVEQAAVYIGIFALRYGYIPDDPRNPDEISITEMEYNRAVELNRPRLIFVMADTHPVTAQDVETGAGAEKLTAFKNRVMTDRVVGFFTSAEDLRNKLVAALEHWQAQRLLWMPDPLPEPGHLPDDHLLPPGSRVGMPRNIHFVGREESLVALADTLLHSADDAKTVITPAAAATGSGGIGKTQLAVEFAHRYGRYFQGVHWINLLGVEGDDLGPRLRAEIAACGAAMNLPNFPEDDLPKQVEMTLAVWRESPPRLIILDNAENTEVVQHALETLAGAQVLITSRWGRSRDWENVGVAPCALDTLKRDQSIDLLRRLAPHLRETADADLDMLAARLGDFPLALDLAGRYLDDMYTEGEPVSVQDFLTELEAQSLDHTALRGWASQADHHSPTQHDMDVRATFLVSWRRVTDPLARRLFRACGYLAPNAPIPADLLRAIAGETGAPLVQARKQLAQPGLLTPHSVDDPLLSIHPLLADFARELDAQEDEESQQLVGVADALAITANQAIGTGLPVHFLPLRPHLEVLAPRADAAEITDAGAIWANLGNQLRLLGDYSGARPHYEHALAIHEKLNGPEHLTVAIDLSNLGLLLKEAGHLHAARQYYERSLAIFERIHGDDHPDIARMLSNLGTLLQSLGDLTAARQYIKRALANAERTDGPDHPTVAIRLNNLGGVLLELGDLPAAKQCHERALAIREQVFGPNHPDVAQSLNNLGTVLAWMNDPATARQHFERALEILEQTFSPDYPRLAFTLDNLGTVLKDLGDLKTARQHYERALAIREKALGPDHPDVAQVLSNLGLLLQRMNDMTAARECFERGLAIAERALSPDHPQVAVILSNLGIFLQDSGDLTGARQCYERALTIFEHSLPPDHPHVGTVLNKMGEVLQTLGDVSAACQYYERALPIAERTLGPNHLELANRYNNLGQMLRAAGDPAAARPYYERALDVFERVFGPDNPMTATQHNNLGLLLHTLGNLPDAKWHIERALAIGKRVFGPQHPAIAIRLNNLGLVLRDLGDVASARQAFEHALRILETRLPPDHPDIQLARENLATVSGSSGDTRPTLDNLRSFLHNLPGERGG